MLSTQKEMKEIKQAEAPESLVGIYWGTFDPPTLAHGNIVNTAFTQLKLSKLLVVINNNSKTGKNYVIPANKRKAMFRQMLASEKYKDSVSVFAQTNFFDFSYEKMKELLPNKKIVAIVGQDSFEAYKKYLGAYEKVAVMPRGDQHALLQAEIKKLGLTNTDILKVDSQLLDISSTKIREAVKKQDMNYLASAAAPCVKKSIETHGFFKEGYLKRSYTAIHHTSAEVIQRAWRKRMR